MGRKGLYIFDREGQHHLLKPLCVLDFYVNEAYQRQGLGKKIFEHMLQVFIYCEITYNLLNCFIKIAREYYIKGTRLVFFVFFIAISRTIIEMGNMSKS